MKTLTTATDSLFGLGYHLIVSVSSNGTLSPKEASDYFIKFDTVAVVKFSIETLKILISHPNEF
jgi:hypothetical protein